MNWLDYILIALGVGFAVEGAVRGLTRQILGLAATILGLLLASWFYGSAGGFLIPYVSHKGVANFLGFVFIFVLVQALGGVAGWVMSKVLKTVGLSWMDRLLGIGFGLVKASLVGVILVLALTAFSIKPLPEAVAGSRLAPVLVEVGRIAAALTPKEMRDGFQRSYEHLRKFWDEQVRPKIEKGAELPGALPRAGG